MLWKFSVASLFLFVTSACDIPFPEQNNQNGKPADTETLPPAQGDENRDLQPPKVETETDDTPARNDLIVALKAGGGDIDRALFWLVSRDKPEAIKLAKKSGANMNATNSEGNRPLSIAVERNQEEAVKALIGEGAEINYVDNLSRSPIGIAAYSGHTNLIKILVGAGGDVNYHPHMCLSPLHMAARFDQTDSILTLVALHANVNLYAGWNFVEINSSGGTNGTPASEALSWNKPKALEVLLENGANPYLKRSDGFDLFLQLESHKSAPEFGELKRILDLYK